LALSELNNVSLAVTYDLDESFDTDRFIKMRLRVCHDGVNPNGSNFNVDDMNSAKDTLKNIPILANVEFDENGQPQFGSHDMSIEKDKVNEGEYRMIYKEVPIGVIPETNNYEVAEYDGKNYVFVDGYVWRGYSNYAEDIIERDKNIKLSMEISVNEFTFNAAKKIYNITDYKYTGITFLNNELGTGMKNAMGTTDTFAEKDNINEKMLIIMQELNETLVAFNKKNTEEGGKKQMDENIVTNATPEEQPAAPAENFEGEPAAPEIPASVESGAPANDKFVKTFELSHDDVRCALYALLEPIETENNDWYYIDAVYDTYFDYASWSGNSLYRQKYTKNGENITFEGDPYEVFVEKLTSDEKAALDTMRANYESMQTEMISLRDYKAKIEAEFALAEKQEIIDKWSENLKDSAEFAALKDKLNEYSKEDLERECKCIFADAKASFTFSAKPKDDGVVRIPIVEKDSVPSSPYGDLFDLYGTK